MIEKNPQALALAFKKCKGKILKIRELKITPDTTSEEAESLIELLATAKAAEDNVSMSDCIKGQRWYLEGLIAFSALTPEKQLDAEYQDAFADSASEAEMLSALTTLAA